MRPPEFWWESLSLPRSPLSRAPLLPPWGLLAWALLGAGSALVPDLDHPSSTVTRSQGFVTGLLSRGMRALSLAVYRRTRTPADRSDGEHRHLGHTPVFAAVVGAVIGLLCHLSWWATLVTVWFLAFIGLRALRKVTWRGLRTALGSWPGAALAALCVSALFLTAWDSHPPGWLVGVVVTLGMIVHSLGDALTSSGVPLAWPFPVKGRRWAMIGVPRWMRFRTGTWPEWVVGAASITGSLAVGYALVA